MQMRQGLQAAATVKIATLNYLKKMTRQINVIAFCFWYHR